MTPTDHLDSDERRGNWITLGAVSLLIGVLIFLFLIPGDSAVLRSVRRTLFGKAIGVRFQAQAGGGQANAATNSAIPAQAGVNQTDEPAEANGPGNMIDEPLERRSITNLESQLFLPDEFSERLHRAGARSGDVQISLEWKNRNDLDLHVIDPFGDEVSYRSRAVPSGGQLDVDMNLLRLAGGAPVPEDIQQLTDRPVENVYWPEKGAPRGRYRVEVTHFARHGGADPTAFSVRVINRGQVTYYKGTITHISAPHLPRVTVCTFMVE